MSGSLSTYLETALLNHTFGGPDYVPPSAFYTALFTVAPTMDGGGTEVAGGNYVRQPVTFSAPSGSPPLVNNPNQVQWAAASADWGTLTSGAVFDAATGGNMLGFAYLVSALDGVTLAPIAVLAGMIFRLPPLGLVLGFTSASGPVVFTPPTRASRLSMRPIAGEVLDGAGVGRMGLVMAPTPP
jgi:hypothetical protein